MSDYHHPPQYHPAMTDRPDMQSGYLCCADWATTYFDFTASSRVQPPTTQHAKCLSTVFRHFEIETWHEIIAICTLLWIIWRATASLVIRSVAKNCKQDASSLYRWTLPHLKHYGLSQLERCSQIAGKDGWKSPGSGSTWHQLTRGHWLSENAKKLKKVGARDTIIILHVNLFRIHWVILNSSK